MKQEVRTAGADYNMGMTGGEIAAAGAAKGLEEAGKAIAGNAKDRDAVRAAMEGTQGLQVAAEAKAARLAVRELFINKCLRPLFRWTEYSHAYVTEAMPIEIEQRLDSIPDENLTSPPPIVAAQVLEGLAFSFEEEDLKNMYLNLLKTASDNRVSGHAHPSFAAIIKNLLPEEARLLQDYLSDPQDTMIAEIRWQEVNGSGGYFTRRTHILDTLNENNDKVVIEHLPSYVANWVRLGLVDVVYDVFRLGENAYEWVENRPEYFFESQTAKNLAEMFTVTFAKGLLKPTPFGRQFYSAVRTT